ncbi:MAG: FAD-binding protein [Candidatus Paceibacterota bacterium]
MEIIQTDTLIIGGGAAGLNAALNLNKSKVTLVEKGGSNSVISPWNLMIKPEEEIREKIIKNGHQMSDPKIVDAFLKEYSRSVEDLKEMGIDLRRSNIGMVPRYSFPGSEVRKIFIEKLKDKNTNFLQGEIVKFLLNENGSIVGAEFSPTSSSTRVRIFFNFLILASGGLGGFFDHKTGSSDSDGSILALSFEAGSQLRDMEFFMFHPFLIVDKRLPRALISGDILAKMEYIDENGNNFLSEKVSQALKNNEHHHIFHEMTKEFYLQSLKSKIFGKLTCSHQWFEKYKMENEFGYVFQNFTKSELDQIEIYPAFHFSIGGLVIDENGQTNQENVYAAGEITGGLHGGNRIGGLAILEALIFGKRAALSINKREVKEVQVPDEIRELGDLGISKEIKNKVWRSLGPIKRKDELEELKKLLSSKTNLTSQERLLSKIVEICLLRKESVGLFYREDLPSAETAEPSFLIDGNIYFGNEEQR